MGGRSHACWAGGGGWPGGGGQPVPCGGRRKGRGDWRCHSKWARQRQGGGAAEAEDYKSAEGGPGKGEAEDQESESASIQSHQGGQAHEERLWPQAQEGGQESHPRN